MLLKHFFVGKIAHSSYILAGIRMAPDSSRTLAELKNTGMQYKQRRAI